MFIVKEDNVRSSLEKSHPPAQYYLYFNSLFLHILTAQTDFLSPKNSFLNQLYAVG